MKATRFFKRGSPVATPASIRPWRFADTFALRLRRLDDDSDSERGSVLTVEMSYEEACTLRDQLVELCHNYKIRYEDPDNLPESYRSSPVDGRPTSTGISFYTNAAGQRCSSYPDGIERPLNSRGAQ